MTLRPSRWLLVCALLVTTLAGASCKDDKPHASGKAGNSAAPASANAALLSPKRFPWQPAAKAEAIAAGKKVLIKHECRRCHSIDDLPKASRPRACVSCHQFLHTLKPEDRRYKKIAKKYGEDILKRYQKNIVHLLQVPDLTLIGKRVRADFLRDYLESPFDLRPALEASMIRHNLTKQEVRAVVRYFAAKADAADPYAPGYAPPTDATKPAPTEIAKGEALFKEKGCPTCHTFGNRKLGTKREDYLKNKQAAGLAINLRFVSTRTRRDALARWIVDPKSLAPHTKMPAMGVTPAQAKTISAFLIFGDPMLPKAPNKRMELRLPKDLNRKVSYEEVKAKVLGRICVHCHMNDFEKDPGPGNLGGLGFGGDQLSMRTYQALVQGKLGKDGKRYSVLEPEKGKGMPVILEVVLRRRYEALRDQVGPFGDHARQPYPEGHLGMPLGLPALSEEEIALLATWIHQGCVGPEKVTGRASVRDGYLVPDGPLKQNKGCQQREPESPKPAWDNSPPSPKK